jgi:hypothetical protein
MGRLAPDRRKTKLSSTLLICYIAEAGKTLQTQHNSNPFFLESLNRTRKVT